MEYLVAIELLPHARLQTISLPASLSMELNILRGLLLSRMQYHNDAARVLYDAMPAAISCWGLTSFQIGIVAAESANCYNMLRKEDIANTIATRCLAARNTPELVSRQDWFYLSLYLVDSLIGSGRYAEAESTLEHLISQPRVTPTIHMMGCLRLSKVRRRIAAENGTVSSRHFLHEGLALFSQVPVALREEYLEEVACSLSAPTTEHESIEAQETLMGHVNDLLDQTGLAESPAQKRYTQAQLEFKQHTLRQEDSAIIPGHGGHQAETTAAVGTEGPGHARPGSPSDIDVMATPITTRRVFSVPYGRDEHFIKRPDVEIRAKFPDHGSRVNIYSIHGKPGIGKTAFVTDFAYTVRDSHSAVIWVKDAPTDEIFDYLSSVAIQLGLTTPMRRGQALEQLFNFFQHPEIVDPERPWLMVFDGIEDEQVLREFWPGGCFGTIIVITRESPSFFTDRSMDWISYIELGKLNSRDATILAFNHISVLEYMSELVLGAHDLQQHDAKDLESLVDLLEYHPAAIKAAASLISRLGITIQDFISKFNKTGESYLGPSEITEIHRQPNHNLDLITIWLMEPHRSKSLMNVIALLSRFDIDETLLCPDHSLIRSDRYPQTVKDFEMMRDQLLESTLIWRKGRRRRLCTSTAVQAIFRGTMSLTVYPDVCCRALLLLADSWPCKFEDSLLINFTLPVHSSCSGLWHHACSLSKQFEWVSGRFIPFVEAVHILECLLHISK